MATSQDTLKFTPSQALDRRLEGFLNRLRRALGDPSITPEIALQLLVASALERSEIDGIDAADARRILSELSPSTTARPPLVSPALDPPTLAWD